MTRNHIRADCIYVLPPSHAAHTPALRFAKRRHSHAYDLASRI
nr:MAG TPA: hypothetical protein [Caudoviricetes sp.]